MIDTKDRDLIEKALSGKRSGYTAIVNQYKGMVYSLAFRIVQNRENAEEVAQDSFLKAFRALPNFRFKSSFSSWLYRIVYTSSISFLRLKKFNHEELTESHVDTIIDQDWDRSTLYDQKFNQDMIKKALEKIPRDDSTLLYLYYFMDQSLTEIEHILEVSSETLKVRLYRARKRLKVHLDRELLVI